MIKTYVDNSIYDTRWMTMHRINLYVGIKTDFLKKIGIFKNLPERVLENGSVEYDKIALDKRLQSYGILPVDKTHPLAKFSLRECAKLININHNVIFSQIKKNRLIYSSDGNEKFVYKKDFECFARHYYPLFIVNQLDFVLSIGGVATLFGVKKHTINMWGKKGVIKPLINPISHRRMYTRDVLLDYLNNNRYRMLSRGFSQYVSAEMARLYIGAKESEFYSAIKLGRIKSIKNGKRRLVYDINQLDIYLDNKNYKKYYGDDNKPYIAISQIKYKYNISELFFNKFIVFPKARLYLYNGNLLTKLDEIQGKHPKIMGYFKQDIEKIINSGVSIKIEDELANYVNIKNSRNRHNKIVQNDSYGLHVFRTDNDNPIEKIIEATFQEKKLKHDDTLRELNLQAQIKKTQMNEMRTMLGLKQTQNIYTSPKKILENSNVPVITTLIYSRGNTSIYKKMKHAEHDVIFVTGSFAYLSIRKKKYGALMKCLKGIEKLHKINIKIKPNWIVFMSNTSCVTDILFYDKLDKIPSNVGVVGSFGFNNLPENYNWSMSKDTYGIFNVYASDGQSSKFIVGNSNINESHDVAIVNGPFIAIRGELIGKFEQKRKIIQQFSDGWNHVGPILSSIAHDSGMLVRQIPIDCCECSDFYSEIGNIDWNHDHDLFIKYFGNIFKKYIGN